MIAARHSSRDLAKLLRGLFMPGDEEPLVVIDEVAPVEALAPGPSTGSMSSVRSSTQEISNTDRTRSSRTNINSGILDGALRAEQSRLRHERRRGQAKAAIVLVAVLAAAGAVTKLWGPYLKPLVSSLHGLLTSPPPPVAAASSPAPVVEPAPASAVARPAPKKRPPKKGGKGDGKTGAAARSGTGDDVIAPSE